MKQHRCGFPVFIPTWNKPLSEIPLLVEPNEKSLGINFSPFYAGLWPQWIAECCLLLWQNYLDKVTLEGMSWLKQILFLKHIQYIVNYIFLLSWQRRILCYMCQFPHCVKGVHIVPPRCEQEMPSPFELSHCFWVWMVFRNTYSSCWSFSLYLWWTIYNTFQVGFKINKYYGWDRKGKVEEQE